MLEKQIQKKILKYLKSKGGIWIKINQGMFAIAGISDILGCFHGFFFALEVKRPQGKMTRRQQMFQIAVKKAGGIAEVVTSVNDTREIIYEFDTKRSTWLSKLGMERLTNKTRQEDSIHKMETIPGNTTHRDRDKIMVQKMADR